MPANQKARKKPKKPQQISEATWLAVEKAVCAGIGYSEAARVFGIRSPHAIIMRSRREHWPIPSRVEERARLLQASLQRQSEAAQERRNGNEKAIEAAAQSWAERGEAHRRVAFDLAHNALKAAARAGLGISDWRDADLCDKVARRNAGLDSEEGSRISFGMTLVNARLENISLNLPKDALPGMPGAQER
jgi:hypothetical protein